MKMGHHGRPKTYFDAHRPFKGRGRFGTTGDCGTLTKREKPFGKKKSAAMHHRVLADRGEVGKQEGSFLRQGRGTRLTSKKKSTIRQRAGLSFGEKEGKQSAQHFQKTRLRCSWENCREEQIIRGQMPGGWSGGNCVTGKREKAFSTRGHRRLSRGNSDRIFSQEKAPQKR